MRGLNTDEYWDDTHKKSGKESRFNPHFFQMTRNLNGRVLNIAVGLSKNFMVNVAMFPCEFHALDISGYAVKKWKDMGINAKKFDVKKGNKLPYPDNTFNFVITKNFLEHISREDNLYLAGEIKRVLKPMGYFIVSCASERFLGGPEPRQHIYPTEQGGVPVWDLLDMYKDLRLLKYDLINAEHYAIFRWE